MQQNISIGGIRPDGADATNELTYMMLTAQGHVHLPHPQLTLRVHRESPEPLLQKAAEVLSLGGGLPQLVGDEVHIASLLGRGIPLEVARDYGSIGCVELGVIGLWGRANGGYFNIPKVLELALNNGIDRMTGEQVGINTGNPREFKSFDDVMSAFKKQMEYCTHLLAIENNVIDVIHAEMVPHVFYSLVIPDCIEKGKDATKGGGRYNWTGPIGVGVANAGDSLAAIKKVIFEDRCATMKELVDVLDANFDGYEELRQKLLAAPKYGADEEYVDGLVKEVVNIYLDPLLTYSTPRGGNQGPSALFSLSVNIPFGWATGALPDGRKAGTPLADGISPTHGCDSKGPTAVLKSASRIDHVRTSSTILNLKFHPSALSGPAQVSKFVDLISTYLVDLKGSHVQCNFVSAETLRDAQANPEKYPDLIIRVTGYSARFCELGKDVQDDIIGRTEHVL
jgi:formate C-acetyltransferase